MNDGLKQRIVGALVLIALGVIFVPVIFDRGRIEPVDRLSQIPPEPDIRPVALPEPPQVPRERDAHLQGEASGTFALESVDDDGFQLVTDDNREQLDQALTKPKPVQDSPIIEDLDGKETKGFADNNGYVANLKLDKPKAQNSSAETTRTNSVRDRANVGVERDKTTKLARAWVLQVASHESAKRADDLRIGLEKLGYKAFTREFDTKVGKRTRVFIGPNISKPALEKAKGVVDARYNVKSILLRFKP